MGEHDTLNGQTNEGSNSARSEMKEPAPAEMFSGPVRGVVNSLAVFERRKETISEFGGKKEGECRGICIVAGTGKQMRLGRWMKVHGGKNGAVVFEVPVRKLTE